MNLLGKDQQMSLFRFFDVLSALCDDVQDRCKIAALQEEANVALALIERDFPISVQVLMHTIVSHSMTCLHVSVNYR